MIVARPHVAQQFQNVDRHSNSIFGIKIIKIVIWDFLFSWVYICPKYRTCWSICHPFAFQQFPLRFKPVPPTPWWALQAQSTTCPTTIPYCMFVYGLVSTNIRVGLSGHALAGGIEQCNDRSLEQRAPAVWLGKLSLNRPIGYIYVIAPRWSNINSKGWIGFIWIHILCTKNRAGAVVAPFKRARTFQLGMQEDQSTWHAKGN